MNLYYMRGKPTTNNRTEFPEKVSCYIVAGNIEIATKRFKKEYGNYPEEIKFYPEEVYINE